jgi:small neutral amino acid transporter SnatA (MarC family)
MSVSPLALFGFFALLESSKKGDVYNILWALVFGFATLNILSLVSRRVDPSSRNRMSFGEMMAVGTVAVAVILLGWEMLYLFKILPLRLH